MGKRPSQCDQAINLGFGKLSTTKSRFSFQCHPHKQCFSISKGIKQAKSDWGYEVDPEVVDRLEQGCFCPVPPICTVNGIKDGVCRINPGNSILTDSKQVVDTDGVLRILSHKDPESDANCCIFLEVLAATPSGMSSINSKPLPGRLCLGNCYNIVMPNIESDTIWDDNKALPLAKNCNTISGLQCPGEGWVRFKSEDGVPMVKFKQLNPIPESELNGDLLQQPPYNFEIIFQLISNTPDDEQAGDS